MISHPTTAKDGFFVMIKFIDVGHLREIGIGAVVIPTRFVLILTALISTTIACSSASVKDDFDASPLENWVPSADNINTTLENGMTPLVAAIEYANRDLANHLIVDGANVNLQDEFGRAPLHEAARNGYDGLVTLLIRRGADVDFETRRGETPLLAAIDKSRPSSTAILLESGADVNKKTKAGVTALLAVAKEDFEETVEVTAMLLEAGADPNAMNKDGENAVAVALRSNNAKLASFLREHGTRLELSDANGTTLLLRCVHENSVDAVRYLAENGAKVNVYDAGGEAAVSYAARYQYGDIVAILLKYGAIIDPSQQMWKGLLSYGVRTGNEELVGALVMSGIDVDKRLIEVALDNLDGKMAQLLVEAGAVPTTVKVVTGNSYGVGRKYEILGEIYGTKDEKDKSESAFNNAVTAYEKAIEELSGKHSMETAKQIFVITATITTAVLKQGLVDPIDTSEFRSEKERLNVLIDDCERRIANIHIVLECYRHDKEPRVLANCFAGVLDGDSVGSAHEPSSTISE